MTAFRPSAAVQHGWKVQQPHLHGSAGTLHSNGLLIQVNVCDGG